MRGIVPISGLKQPGVKTAEWPWPCIRLHKEDLGFGKQALSRSNASFLLMGSLLASGKKQGARISFEEAEARFFLEEAAPPPQAEEAAYRQGLHFS